MAPLLYILILSGVLILLIYGTLTLLDSQDRPDRIWPARDYDFEAGQELFKYLPPQPEPPNTLVLIPQGDQITATWQVCPPAAEEWVPLILRVYSSHPYGHFDVEAPAPDGQFCFNAHTGAAYYAAVGLRQSGDFCPLVLSAPVVSSAQGKVP